MLKLENITVTFQQKTLFSGFSFLLNQGGKAALKGRSGSGKTTLLNIIMGFTTPDSGSVNIAGIPLNKSGIHKIRKQIAWLPQNTNLLGSGNVEQAILKPFTFALNKTNTPSHEGLMDSLSQLGLESDILQKNMESISGGEKQRLGILICKLLKKPLILLDEPTSALDKKSLNLVADYILNDKDLTVLSTSHDEEWLARCNSVVEL